MWRDGFRQMERMRQDGEKSDHGNEKTPENQSKGRRENSTRESSKGDQHRSYRVLEL